MKIRVSKFFFIANIVVLLLMLMGSLLPLFIIEKGQYTFLLFIPASIILILFILNFLAYYFSPFEVNEEGFIKYLFGRKKFNIKKDDIIKINAIFADTNQSRVYCIIFYYHKGPNKIVKTEFSGNLFNLTNVFIALKKYNFPLEY